MNKDNIPDPSHDPQLVVEWIEKSGFPLSTMERDLLRKMVTRRYTGESSAVHDHYELRILYWQVVGYLRGKKANDDTQPG